MSRWIDQFKAHPFNAQWARVQDGLSKAKVDDETIVTDVKELARLRKVVGYLDVMIRGVDPELAPLETWNNFNGQAEACAGQIEAYNSNRNISHIQNANTHADNLLTYLRPYMVGETVARDAARSSLDGYFETFIGYVESFEVKSSNLLGEIAKDKDESGSLYNTINNYRADIEQLKIELFDPENGVQSKIRNIASDAEIQHSKISEVFKEIVVGSEEKESTKSLTLSAFEEISAESVKINAMREAADNELSEIQLFHDSIFGRANHEGEKEGGMLLEFDNLKKEMTGFKEEQKERYHALNTQIDDLLPGAASAGMGSAYNEMKKSFTWPIFWSSVTFYACMAAVIVPSLYSVVDAFTWWPFHIAFSSGGEWDSILKDMVHKLPVFIPIIWLALYATRRRSEYQRLQQEYAHKETLAKSYMSYKKQIKELGDQDAVLLTKLIDKAIDTIAHNASESLDGKHGDKMPIQEIFEKALESVIKSKDELASAVKKAGV